MKPSRRAVVDSLARYDSVVEVGVGVRPAVAAALAERGVAVTATDVVDRTVPASVRFVVDDVTDPDPDVYRDAEAVYGLNLPPELHRPTADAARAAGADCLFTTLGGDQPAVPVDRETLPEGETLYRVRADRPGDVGGAGGSAGRAGTDARGSRAGAGDEQELN